MIITLVDNLENRFEIEARDLIDQNKQSEALTYLRQVAKDTGWLNNKETLVTDPETNVTLAQTIGKIPGVGTVIADIPTVDEQWDEQMIQFLINRGMSEERIKNIFG